MVHRVMDEMIDDNDNEFDMINECLLIDRIRPKTMPSLNNNHVLVHNTRPKTGKNIPKEI